MENNQLMNPELEDGLEESLETSIRPKMLNEYIGQSKVKENMKIYIEAAKKEENNLIMFYFMVLQGLVRQRLLILSQMR